MNNFINSYKEMKERKALAFANENREINNTSSIFDGREKGSLEELSDFHTVSGVKQGISQLNGKGYLAFTVEDVKDRYYYAPYFMRRDMKELCEMANMKIDSLIGTEIRFKKVWYDEGKYSFRYYFKDEEI